MDTVQQEIQLFERAGLPEPDMLVGCPAGNVESLVFYPDSVLREKSQDVPSDFWGEPLNELISDLATTMYMTGGVGLSAIQIGRPLRVFICDPSANVPSERLSKKSQGTLLVAVNPTITVVNAKDTESGKEGCLSFPGVLGRVTRPKRVILKARDRHGGAFVLPITGILSRIIQHEMDHLDGKVFVDCMGSLEKKFALKANKRFHRGVRNDSIRVKRQG